MKTLLEKIEEAINIAKQYQKDNKAITNIWFEFNDVDLKELRSAGKKYGSEPQFDESLNKMRLQISKIDGYTIFCYSRVLKVKQHFVIDEAIKNV